MSVHTHARVNQSARNDRVPYVRVLGSVEVAGVSARPMLGRSAELVAFLALTPCSSTTEFAGAFWPGKTPKDASASMRKLTNGTRRWLGADRDGALFLPRYDAEHGYRVHAAIGSDWADFQSLIGPDVRSTSTRDLVEALLLVRDQPFADAREEFYAWADFDKERMIMAISEAADELFKRAIATQHHVRSRFAAAVGVRVAPEDERARRNGLRAALAVNDGKAFAAQIESLCAFVSEFGDGLELEPASVGLLGV